MSIGKLAPGQQAYYLDTVAGGAEDYYTDPRESPGRWIGADAQRLGLHGDVVPAALGAVLEGRDPISAEKLTRAQGGPSVAGFDATFSAPKSVSLLHALANPAEADVIHAAHRRAVTGALAMLERHAAMARRGKQGLERVHASGLIAAAFDHHTSRAGDPQLHTHVVIANLVHADMDDRWTALDARPVYTWAKTVGTLYEAQLRAELTRTLGVEWGPVRNGIADIAGIPKEVLRAFSQRRAEIETHLEHVGEDTARAAQIAAYATRAPKVESTRSALVAEWRARAEALGLGTEGVERCLSGPPRALAPVDQDALFAELASSAGLTAQHASFGRRDVLRAVADAFPSGIDIADVEALADRFLESRAVVPLHRPQVVMDQDVIRRRDGTVVHATRDEPRWTTTEMLSLEANIVRTASARQGANVGTVAETVVQEALDRDAALSPEQARMVRRVTASGAGVEVVTGVAGAGKTRALAAAREAWAASNYTVVGCALSARAAAGLESGASIPSKTIRRVLAQLDRQSGGGLPPGTVLVVDEAAMVGTRDLARLIEHTKQVNAKLVLVGDHRQLPEIEAGGVFAGLASRLGAARLEENRRQHEAWERRALLRLRNSSVDRAVDDYERHGRIRMIGDRDSAHRDIADRWFDLRSSGGSVVMLATRTRDVDALNQHARSLLVRADQLGRADVVVGNRRFAVGDDVIARRNDYGIGILNGTRATVTAVDLARAILHVRTDQDVDIEIPHRYLRDGHLDHGYAMTVHKAQGATFDHALVFADDGIDRERAYTGLSRGRHTNELFVVDAERGRDPHAPEIDPDPRDGLAAALKRSSAETMALDHAVNLEEPGLDLGI